MIKPFSLQKIIAILFIGVISLFTGNMLGSMAAKVEPPYVAQIIYDPKYEGQPSKLTLEQIKAIEQLAEVESMDYHYRLDHVLYAGSEEEAELDIGYYDAIAVTNPQFSYLTGGFIHLTKGRTFTEAECKASASNETIPVMIPKGIADYEHYDIGSTFNIKKITYHQPINDNLKVSNYSQGSNPFTVESYNFEVIGIFEGTDIIFPHGLSKNLSSKFILPPSFIQNTHDLCYHIQNQDEIQLNDVESFTAHTACLEQAQTLNATYVLNSSANIKKFEKKANKILGPSFYIWVIPKPESN